VFFGSEKPSGFFSRTIVRDPRFAPEQKQQKSEFHPEALLLLRVHFRMSAL
jgi:hypothetical protein